VEYIQRLPRSLRLRKSFVFAFGLGGLVHFDKLSATPGRILGFGGRVRGLGRQVIPVV